MLTLPHTVMHVTGVPPVEAFSIRRSTPERMFSVKTWMFEIEKEVLREYLWMFIKNASILKDRSLLSLGIIFFRVIKHAGLYIILKTHKFLRLIK